MAIIGDILVIHLQVIYPFINYIRKQKDIYYLTSLLLLTSIFTYIIYHLII